MSPSAVRYLSRSCTQAFISAHTPHRSETFHTMTTDICTLHRATSVFSVIQLHRVQRMVCCIPKVCFFTAISSFIIQGWLKSRKKKKKILFRICYHQPEPGGTWTATCMARMSSIEIWKSKEIHTNVIYI